jgi:hypothetical protein
MDAYIFETVDRRASSLQVAAEYRRRESVQRWVLTIRREQTREHKGFRIQSIHFDRGIALAVPRIQIAYIISVSAERRLQEDGGM